MLKCSKCVDTTWHANNKEQPHWWVAWGLAPLVVWRVGVLVVCFLRVPLHYWCDGVGYLVCWRPCMCVPDGWLLPLCGLVVLVVCWWCVGGVLPGVIAHCGLVA